MKQSQIKSKNINTTTLANDQVVEYFILNKKKKSKFKQKTLSSIIYTFELYLKYLISNTNI